VRAGVAAGHPATAQVGIDMLDAGGTAADAAVAAVLASCVAESLLTGIAGGGFATYYDAASQTVTCLDFFVTVPGLDPAVAAMPMTAVEVNFGAVPMQYAVGGASVAVPGVPAGCGEVHARWGRLPWRSVVTPAVRLARRGVPLPEAQARTLTSLAPVMLQGDGAAVYAPDGRLLRGGDLLYHPGMDEAMALLAERGPQVFYTGEIGSVMVEAVRKAGGALSHTDLAAYQVLEISATSADLDGYRVHGRPDLNRTIATIEALPPLSGLTRDKRSVRIADALRDTGPQRPGPQRRGETTNICVVDPAGNACVVTTTLGVGAGVWLPGLGVHLNSMLGEGELLSAESGPGQRMSSMMCPLVVTEGDTLALAAGAAGASRIRTALLHTLVGVLLDDLDPETAIARPRFHVLNGVVHAEPGVPDSELSALETAGYPIQRWDTMNHYFGGASAVGRAGAGGDPRRGGVGLTR